MSWISALLGAALLSASALAADKPAPQKFSAAHEAVFREAAGFLRAQKSDPSVNRGRHLSAQLASERSQEAAAFLLRLNEPILFADYAVASPKLIPNRMLEQAIIENLGNTVLGRCRAASIIAGSSSRALHEALMAEALVMIREDKHLEPNYCARAVARMSLPGAEADLLALFPQLKEHYDAFAMAEALVRAQVTRAAPLLLDWIRRSDSRSIATKAFVANKLRAPGIAQGLAARLMAMAAEPQSAEIDQAASSLASAASLANPGDPIDLSLFKPELLERFSPAARKSALELMAKRKDQEARARAFNPDNLVYWIDFGPIAIDRVRDALAHGVNPNLQAGGSPDNKPVLRAAMHNQEALALLLAAGAAPDATDWQGNSALWLLAGQKPHDPVLEGPYLEKARMLLAAKANPNFAGESRFTPLHRAAAFGFTSMIVLLLDHGANPNAEAVSEGILGLTPLQKAQDSKETEAAKVLAQRGGKTSAAYYARREAQRGAIKLLSPILRGH